MITPISALASSSRMSTLRNLLFQKGGHFSGYAGDTNPGVLFEGVKRQLAILLTNNSTDIYQTRYLRWYADEREILFEQLEYQVIERNLYRKSFPKVSNRLAKSVIQKIQSFKPGVIIDKDLPVKFYYHRAFIYWLKAFSFKPFFYNERDQSDISSNQMKVFGVDQESDMKAIVAILNSTTYYFYTSIYSDCRNIRRGDVSNYKYGLDKIDNEVHERLVELTDKLSKDLKSNSVRREINSSRTGRVHYDEFYIKLSKPIIDEIDKTLSDHYDFSDAELDYIINYDIKYRLGSELEDE